MSGDLRSDLFQRCLDQERTSDFCLSLGSSHSGLNCDRIPSSVGKRHKSKGQGVGTAICSLQVTTLDPVARMKVWAKLDEFMMIVADKLNLLSTIDWDTDFEYDGVTPRKFPTTHRHFYIAEYYLSRGRLPPEGTPALILRDLQPRIDAIKNSAAAAASRSIVLSADAASSAAAAGGGRPVVEDNLQRPASREDKPVATGQPRYDSNSVAIEVGNYHELLDSEDKNSHKWTVFVRAPSTAGIQSVTFGLHPTFNPPQVTVSSPFVKNNGENEFRLQRTGWGTFDIAVSINMTDGKSLKTSHALSFSRPETSKVAFQK